MPRRISLVLALLLGAWASWLAPAGAVTITDCKNCPKMEVIAPGTFAMGSAAADQFAKPTEQPQHNVTFAAWFAIAQNEITLGEWKRCVDAKQCQTPAGIDWKAKGLDENLPVTNVSVLMIQTYLGWLNTQLPAGVPAYRLPSEAEWEYVARAAAANPWWYWSPPQATTPALDQANCANCCAAAWQAKGCGKGPMSVTQFRLGNNWGQYNMQGNVAEWVLDCYSPNYTGAPANGAAWGSVLQICPTGGVVRGGSWNTLATDTRLASRMNLPADTIGQNIGFRLARDCRPNAGGSHC